MKTSQTLLKTLNPKDLETYAYTLNIMDLKSEALNPDL